LPSTTSASWASFTPRRSGHRRRAARGDHGDRREPVTVIWAAVLPQITNPFISFTIYRLDANVRAGARSRLVGGGGIGLDLFQSINLSQ